MTKLFQGLLISLIIFVSLPKVVLATDLLVSVNQYRLQNHLAVLSVDSRLTAAAQAKANDIVAKKYWSHVSPTGQTAWDLIRQTGYSYQTAGENLARGFNSDQALTAWINSPGHRANLLNARYTKTGFGYASYQQDGQEVPVIVQIFATPHQTISLRFF